jgi:DNA-binding LacI/PurR family transcriptional regulator
MGTDRPRRATGRRATLADVARAAGVSASTASLAVNGSGPVSAGTRERIQAAARTLGYLGPDPVARSLRRGRCGVVAVVVSDRLGYAFRDPMMAALLDGLAEEVGAVGSSLLLVPTQRSAEDPDAGDADGGRLTSLPMDAAVIVDCGIRSGALIPRLLARGTVVVGVDGPQDAGVPVVGIDDEGGVQELVAHLAGLGHRDIGVVALPLALDTAPDAPGVPRRRVAAASAAIGALPGGRSRLAVSEWNAVEEGERLAGDLLDATPRPTALLAHSDVLALGCLRAAAARGLSVPGDVSVTGFDGVDLHLLQGTALTTIEQPSGLKGRTAARLVLSALDGAEPDSVLLPTALRIGTTTGPAPA